MVSERFAKVVTRRDTQKRSGQSSFSGGENKNPSDFHATRIKIEPEESEVDETHTAEIEASSYDKAISTEEVSDYRLKNLQNISRIKIEEEEDKGWITKKLVGDVIDNKNLPGIAAKKKIVSTEKVSDYHELQIAQNRTRMKNEEDEQKGWITRKLVSEVIDDKNLIGIAAKNKEVVSTEKVSDYHELKIAQNSTGMKNEEDEHNAWITRKLVSEVIDKIDGKSSIRIIAKNKKASKANEVSDYHQLKVLESSSRIKIEEKGLITEKLVSDVIDDKNDVKSSQRIAAKNKKKIQTEEVSNYQQLNSSQTSRRVKVEEDEEKKDWITRKLVNDMFDDKNEIKALLRTIKSEKSDDIQQTSQSVDKLPHIGRDNLRAGPSEETSSGELEFSNFSRLKLKKVTVMLHDIFPEKAEGLEDVKLRTDKSYPCVYSAGKFWLLSKPATGGGTSGGKEKRLLSKPSTSGGKEKRCKVNKGNGVFPCRLCKKIYKSELGLSRHLVWHGYKAYRCQFCPRKFCKKSQLRKHLNESHPHARPYECSQCSARFKSNAGLIIHMEIHSERRFVCDKCNDEFKHYATLKLHIKRKHIGIKTHHCAQCPAKFTTHGELKLHVSTHSQEKRFECAHCSYKSKNKHGLRVHVKTHFKEKYACPKCSYKCHYRNSLKTHLNVHSAERPFECNICSAKLRTQLFLKNHLTTHSDERPFECPTCPAKFKLKKCLASHLKRHTNVFPYSCPLCPMKFKWKSSVALHLRIHTTAEKCFECPHCNTKFKYKDSLRKHINYTHGDKHVSCPDCDLKFYDNRMLKLHSIKHSTDKRYKCSHCSAKFKAKSNLLAHVVMHFDYRPYKCSQCSAAFKRKPELKLHVRGHTGERPYSCHLCSAKFRQSPHLKTHLTTHLKDKPFACQHCSGKFKTKELLKSHLKIHSDEKKYVCAKCLAKFRLWSEFKMHKKTHLGQIVYKGAHCNKKFKREQELKPHLET